MSLKQRLIVVGLVMANVLLIGALVWAGVNGIGRLQTGAPPPVPGVAQAVSTDTPSPGPPTEVPEVTATLGAVVTVEPTQPPVNPTVMVSRPISGVVSVSPVNGIPGWKYFQSANEGWGIGVPANWQVVEMDPARLKTTLEAIRKKNPGVAADLEERGKSLLDSGLQFFAYDETTAPPVQSFLTNVNLIIDPLALPVSLDTYVQITLSQLGKLKTLAGPVTNRQLQMAAGPAAELRYRVQVVNTNGQPLMTSITQYIVLHGPAAYVLTLSTTDAQSAGYADIFWQIGQSLYWLGP
ncbi:MAG: hypothetical protein WCF84_00690 [Anaerolineae bacterium]